MSRTLVNKYGNQYLRYMGQIDTKIYSKVTNITAVGPQNFYYKQNTHSAGYANLFETFLI